ncbi:MAG: hypothetical protein A3K10_16720 [Bacteroidetes bacterium RIFCSPLOWO2_12_FULL_31_6]|nr:MAG: hypothetical protein A3K10_16720 [Bacteroidetes bacterium RIFCSPLOWO2_12_FULL_31_6]
MNDKRVEVGLKEISVDMHLDSIEYIGLGNYSLFNLKLNNEKLFCQHWSNNNINQSIPYYKEKKIFYFQSFWFWENKIFLEDDIFVNPKSKLINEELTLNYNYFDNEWFRSIDTVEIEIKNQQNQIESLRNIDCGLFLDNFDTTGLSKTQAEDILHKWDIK